MRMIAIIDYDAGNIKSVEKALKYLGEDAVITRDREEILSADKVILPGRPQTISGRNGRDRKGKRQKGRNCGEE